jgi:hypothetical protein
MNKSLALVIASAFVPGCIASPNQPGGGDDQQTFDLEHWNALVAELDARRTEFLGKHVQELAPVGTHLFWLDTTNFNPALRTYDGTTKAKLAYTFSIGDGNLYNYRASANLVVTADPSSNPVVYHAYDATSPKREIASTTFMKPPGAQWNAYAVSNGTVYIVDQTTPGSTVLERWIPGQAPTQVTTLESAGVQVGEFLDFDVSGNTMVFIESGRIWKLDLATNHATWLMNHTEVSGAVDFRADGVMFSSATGLMFFDYAKNALVDISTQINANPFKVNTTFATAAKYYQDFARWRTYVLYVGNSGLFAYDMPNDKIIPLLLSPNSADLRVDYRYPVAIDNGEAFVTGLTSTSGATGADGPTYKIDLKAILP